MSWAKAATRGKRPQRSAQKPMAATDGTAVVVLCRKKQTDAFFALKRIPRSKLTKPEQLERLAVEQRILETVRNPFLCRAFATITTDAECHCFLLEHVDGRPLYQCVRAYRSERANTPGRFPEQLAAVVAAQIVLAVQALHAQGFVHRDLKSGNVLLDRHGRVKVIDFGLAKQLNAAGQRARSFCGTHYIMAPEVFARTSYDSRVDWWGLGVVIYEMVFGRPPWEYRSGPQQPLEQYFESITQTAVALAADDDTAFSGDQPAISHELRSLLRGLLTVNPTDRLGANGAEEVKAHPWFQSIQWERLIDDPDTISIPFEDHDSTADTGQPSVPPVVWMNDSLSSAESIDSQDNAKYFADF